VYREKSKCKNSKGVAALPPHHLPCVMANDVGR